jgi:hypothetical protein
MFRCSRRTGATFKGRQEGDAGSSRGVDESSLVFGQASKGAFGSY